MTITSKARSWFSSHHKQPPNSKTYTSKFYTPGESWSKAKVWWIEIPLTTINQNDIEFVNLICQKKPNNENNFHYLKVPVHFLRDNMQNFHVRQEKISLYLSAEPGQLFKEERGHGNVHFDQFLV
ncbi:MAG TPA: hypothetical protein VK498_04495 [Ferruginibacter sp.]|nr:hypothetical protein [Ferruginibacter sp.]